MYNYFPEDGHFGEDRFVMQVEKAGVKVTIHYVVVTREKEDVPIKYCPPPEEWKIPRPSVEDHDTPDSWYRATSLYVLSGASLGQTTGNQITLDADAAGYGWWRTGSKSRARVSAERNEEAIPGIWSKLESWIEPGEALQELELRFDRRRIIAANRLDEAHIKPIVIVRSEAPWQSGISKVTGRFAPAKISDS
jgi:hypothetical protein